jgi:hypothetical protein
MRKFVIALLLSGAVASPAFAQDHDNGRGHRDQQQQQQQQPQQHQERGDRGQAHEQRQRGENEPRPQRFNDGNFVRQQQQMQQVQQGEARGFDRSRFERGNQVPQQVTPQQVEQSRQRWNGERGKWNRGGSTGGEAQQVDQSRQRWNGDRSNWNGQRGDYRQQQVYQQQQQQQQVQNRSRWAGNNGSRWNREWRGDRRYDWRHYRNSHRSIFHLGVYFDPFGYGYQPFDIGYQLQPRYFGQQYWIDPAMYSLPYPPPGTTWVRYWNDAVLVDMYSGQVVDVIHDFFW